METLTIAFTAIVVLAGMAALSRRSSPPGRRRNALSVTLVVLALLGAFLLCFVLGSLVRGERSPATAHASGVTERAVTSTAGSRLLPRDRPEA